MVLVEITGFQRITLKNDPFLDFELCGQSQIPLLNSKMPVFKEGGAGQGRSISHNGTCPSAPRIQRGKVGLAALRIQGGPPGKRGRSLPFLNGGRASAEISAIIVFRQLLTAVEFGRHPSGTDGPQKPQSTLGSLAKVLGFLMNLTVMPANPVNLKFTAGGETTVV